MSFFEEFKKFAMRGNVIDLAVGVVIGGAFGKITSSLVDNIIMPPLSLLFGKVDFSGLFISLNGQHYDTLKAAQDAHAPIFSSTDTGTSLKSPIREVRKTDSP